MVFKKAMKRFTTSVEDLDQANLRDYFAALGVMPTSELEPRARGRIGGEVRSVRIVPRAGTSALEVTITDGRGSATAVFLGRRKIAGIIPGRKIVVEGVAGRRGNRFLFFNPIYTLLA